MASRLLLTMEIGTKSQIDRGLYLRIQSGIEEDYLNEEA